MTPTHAVPTDPSERLAAATLALRFGQPGEALELVEQGLGEVDPHGADALRVDLCSLGIRALADTVEAARIRSWRTDLRRAQVLADALLEQIDRIAVLQADRDVHDPHVLAALAAATAERGRLTTPDEQ